MSASNIASNDFLPTLNYLINEYSFIRYLRVPNLVYRINVDYDIY